MLFSVNINYKIILLLPNCAPPSHVQVVGGQISYASLRVAETNCPASRSNSLKGCAVSRDKVRSKSLVGCTVSMYLINSCICIVSNSSSFKICVRTYHLQVVWAHRTVGTCMVTHNICDFCGHTQPRCID